MNTILTLFTDFARKAGITDNAFIVGGAVRDILMNKEIKDMDIAIMGDALKIARRFAKDIDGSFVLLDEDFEIARVVKDNQFIDICRMRGSTIYDDLADRDITANAMAMPLHPFTYSLIHSFTHLPEIIDPFNGRDDLKHGIIRMVSEENLIKDPLRLLRVFRFATSLDFKIENQTLFAVKNLAPLIKSVAVERITEELKHILKAKSSYETIKSMHENNLLIQIFPEISSISSEILNSILQSYEYVEHILNNLLLYFPEDAGYISNYFADSHRIICLKLSVLFSTDDMAEKIAVRLKMSNKEIEFIHNILANHHHIKMLDNTDKITLIKLIREFMDNLYPLMIFNIAMGLICQLKEHQVLSSCRELLKIYHDEIIPRMSIMPLITGDDLIREFHLKPSPLFKEILDTIESMTLEGKLYSREDAIKETEKILKLRSVM
ncbi:MAG: hypothetical protein C0415_05165 [Thermodesulfovibrio sp.]|nr:hypothetical protein [Thermodesulfovibrio sp.]